jgi:predicted DNA-binding transcriptional regulator AlpA
MFMNIVVGGEEYVELEDVLKITGINQTALYIKVKYNEFPKPERIVVPTPRKRSLWKRSEIDEYLEKTREKNS